MAIKKQSIVDLTGLCVLLWEVEGDEGIHTPLSLTISDIHDPRIEVRSWFLVVMKKKKRRLWTLNDILYLLNNILNQWTRGRRFAPCANENFVVEKESSWVANSAQNKTSNWNLFIYIISHQRALWYHSQESTAFTPWSYEKRARGSVSEKAGALPGWSPFSFLLPIGSFRCDRRNPWEWRLWY